MDGPGRADQARARLAQVGARYVPIVTWLPAYPAEWRRADLVAALTSWGVMVPVAMAYAALAGLPPQYGLITAFAALAAYAIFGTSRQVKVTTSSTMAIMSAAVVVSLAGGDPDRYLALTAGLALGAGLLAPVFSRATPETVLYAALSLTIVRILPVAVAMLRTGFAVPTLLYVGWFGPRGLASIVFAGVVVEAAVPGARLITDVVLLTVAISLVVHGVTAAFGARRYAAWFERAATADASIPEAAELPEGGLYHRGASRRGMCAG